MSYIVGIVYFGLGVVQLFAMIAGMTDYIGLHWIIAGPLAMLLAYVPLIGSVLGVLGAVYAWGWDWWQAVILFFGPLIVITVLTLAFDLLDAVTARSRARS